MKRKGFTLIELLAVIVILAVIAIMITPMIVSTINSAKENAVKASARNYINGIEEYIAAENAKGTYITDNTYEVSYFSKVEAIGQKPSSGTITIKNGQADSYTLVIGDYEVTKNTGSDDLTIKPKSNTDVAITYPISIGELVLKKFPELELAPGGGCKNPDDSKNYTYLGGCYLKGQNDIKSAFYSFNLGVYSGDGLTKEMLDSLFVDGKFSLDKYNEIVVPIAAKHWGETVDELYQDIKDAGYSTYFEYNNGYKSVAFNLRTINNNYVWYSGFVWRIMGINSDGNIRMITEENVTAMPWGESSYKNPTKSPNAQEYNNSYAKKWTSQYFYDHLDNTEKMNVIKNTPFCEDNTPIDDIKQAIRITCSKSIIWDKSGLLSFDEYNLSGGFPSYLNNGQSYWTLTPQNSSFVWIAGFDGSGSDYVTKANGLRPVVTISSDATITGGDGTLSPTSNGYILNQTLDDLVGKKISEVANSGEYIKYDDRTYRVVETNSTETKLILDEFYDSNDDGILDVITYRSGLDDIVSILNSSTFQKWLFNGSTLFNNLKTGYVWNFGASLGESSYDYETYFKSTGTTFNGNAGLIKVGEILSTPSLSMLTIKYTSRVNNDIYDRHINLNLPNGAYWTLTTHSTSSLWAICDDGSADSYPKTYSFSFRPVIVIDSNATITRGNGTLTSPFELN